jgi:hypothetical protein
VEETKDKEEETEALDDLNPKKYKCIPNILMLLNNRIEFDGSLLRFKNKASSVLNDNIPDPPIDII